MGSRGWRDSEAIVTGRAKRREDSVKEEKAERRVGDAGGRLVVVFQRGKVEGLSERAGDGAWRERT